MTRIFLISLTSIAIFVAIASWAYVLIAFAMWMLVFGDDSHTFGYYALAVAIPIALVLSTVFTIFAIRRRLSSLALVGSIVAAILLELLVVIALNS